MLESLFMNLRSRKAVLALAISSLSAWMGCFRVAAPQENEAVVLSSRLAFPSYTWLNMTFDTILAVVRTQDGDEITYRGENTNPTLSPIKVTIKGRASEKKRLAVRFYQRDVLLAESGIDVTLGSSGSDLRAVVNRTEAGKRFFQPKGSIRVDLTPMEFGDFRGEDTLLLTCESDSAFAWTLTPSQGWLDVIPASGRFTADGEARSIVVRVDRRPLPEGISKGFLVLRSHPEGDSAAVALDTIQLSVLRKIDPIQSSVQGVVRGADGQGAAGVKVTLAGAGLSALTEGNGFFKIANPPPGRHVLIAEASGTLGAADTVVAEDGKAVDRNLTLLSLPTVDQVPVGWEFQSVSSLTRMGEDIAVASQDLFASGLVALFPLGNPNPALVNLLPQGNRDSGSLSDARSATELAGDGKSLFLSYPGFDPAEGRLGRLEVGTRKAAIHDIGMDPFGLLLDGGNLLAAGRTLGGRLALGEFRLADLSRVRIDSLDLDADFNDATPYGPKVAAHGDSYYLVDGAGPRRQGRVFRLDKATRKVVAEARLEDSQANDVAVHGGRVYVASLASARKEVAVFDLDLKPAGAIPLDAAPNRIAFADTGSLAGYGFVTTNGPAVWVIHRLHDKPMGKFSLAGGEKTRSLAVHGAAKRMALTTVDKVFVARW